MEEELKLVDLIDVETLQRIQDAFCEMTGIAAGIADLDGVAITKDSKSCRFCQGYTKASKVGLKYCQSCDKKGGELALLAGKPVAYTCHAGLIDFAAPIMAHGKMIGSFIGGQVATKPLNEEKIRVLAAKIEVDPDEYVCVAKEVRIIEQEQIDKAMEFIYTISNVLSEMAYSRYMGMLAKQEVERAANIKSDFLANMSHEIRTPMNAVIGMAEMALREDLPSVARDYIYQIKSSGKTLLAIINDILDFSKIESGKMKIQEDEYAPMSLINDMTNIIMTRIGSKKLELILDVSPNIPYRLLGDSNRINQVIINIANNAVKFTREGKIVIKVDCVFLNERDVELYVSVEDTGIGIKKEDMGKLFQSFQQVDSKRNRNIEGSGLGLVICKNLIGLMNGRLNVESEYEKGSTFSVAIPQKLVDAMPSVRIKEGIDASVGIFVKKDIVREQIEKDVKNLQVPFWTLQSADELDLVIKEKIKYLIVDRECFSEPVEYFLKTNPGVTGVLLIDFHDDYRTELPNLVVAKKPFYILGLANVLNHESAHLGTYGSELDQFNFEAPDAKVLIVDDNAVNLSVAVGLLEPLNMQVDKATSGKQAIEMISEKMYDLIFMDHMMPEVDGVETTRIIRRFHEEYNDVPIIALTANAISGMKEMFLSEGMNDFVAKPIELKVILSKIRQWLPDEVIKPVGQQRFREERKDALEIPGLDTKAALQLLGNEELYRKVLKDYFRVIRKKSQRIIELERAQDWHNYTIEVHALKSASRQIGAMELARLAEELEDAGRQEAVAFVKEKTSELISLYGGYYTVLEPYCKEEEKENSGQTATRSQLEEIFATMRQAMEDLNLDGMEDAMSQLEMYEHKGQEREWFAKLQEAVGDIDIEACELVIAQWEKSFV